MRAADPALYEARLRRVIAGLEVAGHYDDALAAALDARLTDAVARLVEAHGFGMLERGEVDRICDATALLGTDEGPVATALRGYLEAARGRLDTAEAWFARGLDKAQTLDGQITIALYYARELSYRGRADAHTVLEPYIDRDLTGVTLDHAIDVESSYAQALLIAGREAQAVSRTDNVMQRVDSTVAPAVRVRVFARAAFVYIAAENVAAARAAAQEAIDLAHAHHIYEWVLSAYSVLYSIASDYDDDAPAALRYLEGLSDAAGRSGTVRLDLYALVGIYELQAYAGDHAAMERTGGQIGGFDIHYATHEVMDSLLPARALQLTWSGRFREAHALLAPTVEHQASDVRRAMRSAELALYAAAAGDVAEARRAAQAAQDLLAGESIDGSLLSGAARLLLGFAGWLTGEPQAARAQLAAGLTVVGRAPRWSALGTALSELLTADRPRPAALAALRSALRALRAAQFGGFAALIEALPARALGAGEPATIGTVLARGAPVPPYSGVRILRSRNADRIIARGSRTDFVDQIDASIDQLMQGLTASAPLMAEHSRAVSAWCARLGRRFGLDPHEIVYLTRCGLIHDVGKVITPTEILDAERRLTAAEWEVMREHVMDGVRLLGRRPELESFIPIVRAHHERLDGRGYPDGLHAGAIPLAARIVTVADSFNAMIGRRAYRPPMAPSEALDELYRHRQTQFDPEVVDAMVALISGSRSPVVV